MKLFLTALAATGIATAVAAGNSDRYNDLRFDSAVGHVSDAEGTAGAQTFFQPVAFSSRSTESEEKSYPYINPYGVGPHNDSR